MSKFMKITTYTFILIFSFSGLSLASQFQKPSDHYVDVIKIGLDYYEDENYEGEVEIEEGEENNSGEKTGEEENNSEQEIEI